MSALRFISSPPTSPDDPGQFTFALPPAPASPPTPSGAPLPPSLRFDQDSMHVFGARPMDDLGREHALYRCPNGCGRVVMAATMAEHISTCVGGRGDLNGGARRAGLATGPGSGYKKGKNGLKRGESEVSPSPSETPSKKRSRYSPSRSVGSVDTTYPSLSTAAPSSIGQDQGTSKDKERTAGMIDAEDGRMWLENGRKETKKQMSKRLAEERRVQRREEVAERERVKAGLAAGTVVILPDPKAKKAGPKPIKEYEPDKHCGVPNDLGNPCVRKLDCKIHTVGDKRNVLGRTTSFDDCLRVYRGEAPRGNGPETAVMPTAGEAKGPKKPRKRGTASDEARRKVGFNAVGNGSDGKEEDWAAHPIEAMHEFAALLEAVRRENVLLEGLVRRRACGELGGRVAAESEGGSQAKGKKGAERKDDLLGTVPPPNPADQSAKAEPTAASTVQEPAFGGFDFLQVIAPAPATTTSTKDDTTKSPKKDTVQPRPPAPVPTPTYGPNLLARESFAGGATTGSWHFDRRRMLGAEKCFGDILAQLQN